MNITVLIIEHKHGFDIYPCATPTIADAELYGYVKTYWNEEFPDEPIPSDSELAINRYFEDNEREFYTIETMELIETCNPEKDSQ